MEDLPNGSVSTARSQRMRTHNLTQHRYDFIVDPYT
jgi:hypothetical protein